MELKPTTRYRGTLWLVLLVVLGQALGFRPASLAACDTTVFGFGHPVQAALSFENTGPQAAVRADGAEAPFVLTVAWVECKEIEEYEERDATFRDLQGIRSASTDPLAGLFARYVATLPWGQGHEARDLSISRHLLLGVFRL